MIGIDEVVVRVCKECWAFAGRSLLPAVHCAAMSREALARWIRKGCELWSDLARCTKRRLIQGVEILANSTWGRIHIDALSIPFFLWCRELPVCIRFDQAGIDRHPLAADKAFRDTSRYSGLE